MNTNRQFNTGNSKIHLFLLSSNDCHMESFDGGIRDYAGFFEIEEVEKLVKAWVSPSKLFSGIRAAHIVPVLEDGSLDHDNAEIIQVYEWEQENY